MYILEIAILSLAASVVIILLIGVLLDANARTWLFTKIPKRALTRERAAVPAAVGVAFLFSGVAVHITYMNRPDSMGCTNVTPLWLIFMCYMFAGAATVWLMAMIIMDMVWKTTLPDSPKSHRATRK